MNNPLFIAVYILELITNLSLLEIKMLGRILRCVNVLWNIE